MCNKESMIADFYPEIFGTDLNGKKNDWEAVVLIPFIHEQRLLEAMRSKVTCTSGRMFHAIRGRRLYIKKTNHEATSRF